MGGMRLMMLVDCTLPCYESGLRTLRASVYKDRVCLSLVVVIRIYRSLLVTGEYQVLCKGAESSVLKKCVAGPIDATIEHVDYYASVSFITSSVSITTPI